MIVSALRKSSNGRNNSVKKRLGSRPRLRPFLEPLEDRVVLAAAQLGLALPSYPANLSPFGTAVSDLSTAEVNGLYHFILGREPDASGQNFWTTQLQSGITLAKATDVFLKSLEFTNNLIESYYATLLGRPADGAGLGYWRAVWIGTGDTNNFIAGFTSSSEYTNLHPTDSAFVQSLYTAILGRQGSDSELGFWQQMLSADASRSSVATAIATSDEALAGSIEQVYQSFLQRPAETDGLSFWLDQARHEPLAIVLGQILSSAEYPFVAAAGTAARPLSNFYGFNQQTLTSDPVTDPVSFRDQGSDGLAPMKSPWDQALVFPSVPYDSIATGTAAQPTLQLPPTLVSALKFDQGLTFQFWFQAKNPGVLLSANLPAMGGMQTTSYPAPLIYINADGNLVAGLFDQTSLSVVPHQYPLSWKDADGQTQIGAANPLVSQVGVLDNTWHHVALVVSPQSETLYLDGLLQGMSQPQYHQSNTIQSSPATLVVPLDKPPTAGQMISGTISQLNPVTDQDFGSGGTSEIYRFQGFLPTSGSATLNLTSASGSAPVISVNSVTYSPASGNMSASLTFQLSGSFQSANALSIETAYLTADSAYSFEPASTSTWSMPLATFSGQLSKPSFGGPTSLTAGGAIFLEPSSNLYPATNYPQGFVGTMDEIAVWNAVLSQNEVQAADSESALLVKGPDGLLPQKLIGYFPFTKTVSGSTNEWPNVVDPASFATGPSKGTLLASVVSTIPTDPFDGVTRLPGGRDWGLDIMTPLASPSLSLQSGKMFEYKVGLAAGDQLQIEAPEGQNGSFALVVEDDLGRTSPTTNLAPGGTQYLAAARTGTYQLTITWTADGNQNAGVVNFGLLPGPLNSVMELFSSFVQGVSQTQTNTVQAYSDPALPGINASIGTETPTGAANYWPLWTDTSYFPLGGAYQPVDLNAQYQRMVQALIALDKGMSDFANINGSKVTDPTQIQKLLDQVYENVYGKAPPMPPGLNPFPVAPAATPQDAVYEFLYNADLLRQTIYGVLTGQGMSNSPTTLPGWIRGVIDGIVASNVPKNIATTIAAGQTQEVHNIPININQPSRKQSVGEILLGGLIWAVGGVLAAIPGLGEAADAGLALLGAGLAGGGAALGQSFADNAFSSDARTVSFTVPVTSITNSELNYDELSDMGGSIQAGALQLWNNILSALTTAALPQSVMSNFGLLKAFSVMSGTPLGDDAANPANAVTTSLERSSWHEMIPASFNWAPVAPPAFPTGNGQTNDWVSSTPYPLNGTKPDLNGITSADFNRDGKIDLAVANFGTSNVNLLKGAGDSTFGNATLVSLNTKEGDGPNGALGITSGDFNGDGNPDLAVSDFTDNVVSIVLGNGDGSFQLAQTQDLNGGTRPWGIVSGDFNNDHKVDLAVANYRSDTVTILIGNGDGSFQPEPGVTFGIFPGCPTSIATGDFNNDGNLDLVVASQEVSPTPFDSAFVLIGNGNGTFQKADYLFSPNVASFGPPGIVVGDFNGDHFSDVAVTNNTANSISVFLNKGDGTFQDSNDYSVAMGSSGPSAIALEPTVGGPPNLVVTCTSSNTINVFFNPGAANFLPAISIPIPGSEPAGITIADFANDGLGQAAIINNQSSDVVLLSPVGVGNTATFLPGTSPSNIPLTGPTNLDNTIDSTALDKLLTQIASLQGGNTTNLGPFNEQSLITPGGTLPPNFMAFTSLVYPNNQVPLTLNAPGLFLSLTPATLNESGNNGDTELSYTQNGAYLAGWQLLDSNLNPIAPGTLLDLFGTPAIDDKSLRPVGVNLTPVDPSQPFAAFNGGWYFNAQPVNDAAASWADAFFGWGLSTSNYSPRSLTPSAPLIGTLPNTTTPNVSNVDIAYKLSFQAAADSPPSAPVFTSASSIIFTEGFAGGFTVQARAAVHPILNESATDVLHNGVTFNKTTGALSGMPAVASAAIYTLHFRRPNRCRRRQPDVHIDRLFPGEQREVRASPLPCRIGPRRFSQRIGRLGEGTRLFWRSGGGGGRDR